MRVVCAVFILKPDGSALFQLRDNKATVRHPGKWSLPGGHQDPGESLEECARREVLEETGYRCGDLHLFASFEWDDGDGDRYPLHLFWTPFDSTQSVTCYEGQAIEFISQQEAHRYPILEFLHANWARARELVGGKG